MQALLKPLLELAEYEDIVKKKKEAPGVLMLTGCVNSQKTHMMYALSDGCCYKVIACSSEAKAKQIYEEYRFLDAAISFYPAKDLLFYQADIRSKELVSQRMQVIQAVLKGEPITVVASFDAFMDALLPKEMIKSRVIKICSDETLNLDELSVKLAQCGYDREIEVAGPGQFAVRGGILDVYPLTEELPVRIELWGDEVDSIRTFDPETQPVDITELKILLPSLGQIHFKELKSEWEKSRKDMIWLPMFSDIFMERIWNLWKRDMKRQFLPQKRY